MQKTDDKNRLSCADMIDQSSIYQNNQMVQNDYQSVPDRFIRMGISADV